jgi:CHAD domain-containing protein
MKEHLERELKLTPGAGFVLPELGGEHLPTRVFMSTYHDTADLALARHGVTFRHRVEDGAGVWQLKLPKGIARIELELHGPPARPPIEMTSLLIAYLRGRSLVPVARLRTRRESVRARGAEIVEDSVSVLDGPRVTRRFREVEVELLEGDERTLRRLEKELRRAGAGPAEQRPKLYRALDLTLRADAVELTPDTPAGEALGLAFEEQLRRLLAHDPGTRLGSDPEDLHQFRVATRRLRAFLRTARPLLGRAWAGELRGELGWLGRAIGPARDLDVLIDRLVADLAELGEHGEEAAALIAHFEERRLPVRAAVVEALSSERYLALLDRLELAAAPPLSGSSLTLTAIFAKEVKALRRAVRGLGKDPPDEKLHAVRIDVKRARYAAELAAHELGKQGAAFVAAAKEAQDVLGEHQDSVVAELHVGEWAEAAGTPAAMLFAARLADQERERQEAAREAWPAAWKELQRRGRKTGA